MQEKYDMEELKPVQLAAALDVPQRTIQFWLRSGALQGKQKMTGRWVVSAGEARRFIRERKIAVADTEALLDAWLDAHFAQPVEQEEEREVVHA
jgi:hypothetical protein